ncbi:caspase family protein [Curvibacter delicatus]|uniref:caspase family protein n=1 Tax=Curvibacter delicatus TaxID=80879 RepID=UPI000AFF965B|nr:caspase family protein [Curvibacter delicatus]
MKMSRWIVKAWLSWWVLPAGLVGAQGATPAPDPWPQQPFLGIDSAAHTDEAGYIVLTPDERHAVTASYDGTLRVWDVQTGELRQRFFFPKTSANGARLRGLAMAPDGQRVAVTGYDLRHIIMILSLQTGRVERVIQAPEDTASLAWSPDGRFLAAGKPRGVSARGIRIYNVDNGAEVFRDTDYDESDVTGLAFRADGTLFAATSSGRRNSTVKLYRPERGTWHLAASKVPRWGDASSRWDAAGKTILVGARTRLDGETLNELPHDPDRRGTPSSMGFSRLAQSPDGKYFFGATWSFHHAHGFMRRWSGGGRSDSFVQLQLPDPRVADLAVTRKGEVVYVSDRGAVGLVGGDFKLAWRVAHDTPNLENRPQALKVTDAGWVALPVATAEGDREVAFNLASPEFAPLSRVRERWNAPATSGRGVKVLAWEGTRDGTVNDVRLPLKGSNERSLCVAVHSTDGTVAVGSNRERLYRVSAKGERLWVTYLGSDVTAVNLIEPRDLVVATTSNGMLWLFRWSTGAPVMAYYLQPLSRRWLAISSQGYYEASTGAEDLAGWIVNPSDNRVADFMPMSRLRSTLLLSGLGRQAWESGKEDEAIRLLLAQRSTAQGDAASPKAAPATRPDARPSVPPPVVAASPRPAPPAAAPTQDNDDEADAVSASEAGAPLIAASAVRLEALPPRIEVISPGFEFSSEKRQVRVRFKAVSAAQAPVTHLRTTVVSASATSKREEATTMAAGDERELVIDVPAEDAEIRLVAENRYGASVPTLIRMNYTGPRQQLGKGNLFLLAAGVSRYDNTAFNLGLPSKDARDFVATLQGQRGARYNEVYVKQLLDKDASKKGVEAGFQWLKQNVTAQDTVMVFFAGHGLNEGSAYYFMTHEADLDRLPHTAVPFNTIRDTLAGLPGRVVIFVDTCHSGNVIGKTLPRRASDATNAINDLASSENGLVVFASSTGEQLSQENPAWGNGAFTKAVVEGLRGAADFKQRGRVTYKGLDAYVADRVDELTRGEQTPVTPVLQGVPDFTLAELRR